LLTSDQIVFLGCEVKEYKTSTMQACIFPFEFDQIAFDGCTTMFNEEKIPWCATQIDAEGKGRADEGFWGYCHETCPLDVNGTSNSIISVV
jgi:hypothetical protein